MALQTGTRLGPYEVISPLGSGGMGEVYKARDPRLNRLIAIKLLPAAAAGDPERRDRFEREAQAIAALNHPNIVTIHSVEEADGLFFLTMELAYQDSAMTNIWVQPLDGTTPHQLTHFTDGRTVGDFAWSHDGKRLAVSRVSVTNDIVLFKGLRR